jgi:hypothetical protein
MFKSLFLMFRKNLSYYLTFPYLSSSIVIVTNFTAHRIAEAIISKNPFARILAWIVCFFLTFHPIVRKETAGHVQWNSMNDGKKWFVMGANQHTGEAWDGLASNVLTARIKSRAYRTRAALDII